VRVHPTGVESRRQQQQGEGIGNHFFILFFAKKNSRPKFLSTMGDFQANFQRPDTGIYTAEGNVAGKRAAELEKKRKQDQESFEQQKEKIEQASSSRYRNMDSKFAGGTSAVEEKSFKARTVGLVSAEDFKRAAAEAAAEQPKQSTTEETPQEKVAREKAAKKERKKRLKEKKKMMSTLSFANDEEEDDIKKQPKSKKDPTIDTSFLPDKQRDKKARSERERLEREWKEQQEAIKNEKLEITYSYWDGSGHRRQCVCLKGNTIGDFLEQARQDLSREFRELSNIASDALIYVKEDLMIPQDLTFYDLIVTKARGKSGPLFSFDVHDDVRVGPIDSRIETDESHPGKVVERRWYERNKHIFPASRWELYDPTKDYGSYTIKDSKKKK